MHRPRRPDPGPTPTPTPDDDDIHTYAELHWRSRTPRAEGAFDTAVADPNVRDIAPLMVLRYSGRYAEEAATDIWEAPTREHFPTLEVPHAWIADFREQWDAEVRLWPGALCLLGELPDGRWQIALVSGEPRAIALHPGKPLMFDVVEHRVAWVLRWHTDAFVHQRQWTRMHPGPEGRAIFEDLFNRSGWFFVQVEDERRTYGVLAVNRLEVVRPDIAAVPAPEAAGPTSATNAPRAPAATPATATAAAPVPAVPGPAQSAPAPATASTAAALASASSRGRASAAPAAAAASSAPASAPFPAAPTTPPTATPLAAPAAQTRNPVDEPYPELHPSRMVAIAAAFLDLLVIDHLMPGGVLGVAPWRQFLIGEAIRFGSMAAAYWAAVWVTLRLIRTRSAARRQHSEAPAR